MSEGELTGNKIGNDYLHPAEKIVIPDHIREAFGNAGKTEVQPDDISDLPDGVLVEAESEVDTTADEQQTDESVAVESIADLSDEMPEEICIDIDEPEAIPETIVEEPKIIEPAILAEAPAEVTIELTMSEQEHEIAKPVTEPVKEIADEYPDQFLDDIEDDAGKDVPNYIPPKHNFNVTWEPKFKDKKTDRERNPITELSMLSTNYDEFNVSAEKSSDDTKYTTEEDKLWLMYLQDASKLFHEYRTFDKTLSREGSSWEQLIKSEAGPLTLSRPNFKKNNEQELVGEKAILKMSSAMNLGQMLSVPFWHSGIWLKLKAPADAILLNLENRIAEEKAMLGRQSNGFVFSNASAYIYDYLTTAILSEVYGGSTDKRDIVELRKILKVTDIPTLVWGFLSTIYPNGYPLAQPCVNHIGNCNHVEHEMIMISKLMWVDKSALTDGQIKHMTKRDKIMSEDEIAKYQQELAIGGDKLVIINEKLSVVLAVPSIQDYIDAGYKWVEGIERMVTNSFAASKTGEERNEYIMKMSATMSLRQYSHWIKEIQFYDDPSDPDTINYIKDKDTLEEAMDNLSKDVEVTNEIIKKVAEYIDSATMAVVGVPRYQCPVCNEDQGKSLPEDRYIIPLDVVRIFFILQSQRMLKVMYSMN